MTELFTIGHSTHSWERFLELLSTHRIEKPSATFVAALSVSGCRSLTVNSLTMLFVRRRFDMFSWVMNLARGVQSANAMLTGSRTIIELPKQPDFRPDWSEHEAAVNDFGWL